jgi:hypothetical protein
MIDEASLLRTPSAPIQPCGIISNIRRDLVARDAGKHCGHKKGEALTFVGASSDAKEVSSYTGKTDEVRKR